LAQPSPRALRGRLGSRRPEKGLARAAGESVGFETSLSPDEQRIWDGAVAVYVRDVASKDLLFDRHMTALKVALGTAGDDLPSPAPGLPAAVRSALVAAAPIYRAHAWAADDRADPVDQALDAASRDLHVAVPRSLWHVVLFYTAGALTKQALAHRGVTYEPYLYKTGLFDRAWPMYRPAIEAVLPDFIAGKRTREDMAHALVRMLTGGQRQALQADHSVPQPAPSEGKPKPLGESHGRPVLMAYLAQSR
jgi:hypothetical protein